MSFSIADLAKHYEDNNKGLSRGQNHYDSGHIISFTYDNRTIRAKCMASMKQICYAVQVCI